jgi:hypothetical protein
MSLINCPECRKPVSAAANACPHCGFTFTPDVVAVQKVKKQNDELASTLIAIALTAIGVFLFVAVLGVFALLSPPSSSSTTFTSANQYDDATDRQLKDLPSLRGYSDREKEQIIGASKKLMNAVNELERRRGY